MVKKKDIRKRVLAQRNGMSGSEWEKKSFLIYEQFIKHPFFLEADKIYCYVDCRHEVDTHAIIERSWKLQKKVAVPKTRGNDMEFFYIQNFQELEDGSFHIPEPTTGKQAEKSNALIVIPGIAFDHNRNRIGYGKGYYDKYLIQCSQCKTIALAFEFQMLNFVPADSYDIRPDTIITEETIYV